MNLQRKSYSSGTTWEPVVGYSRAVRVGRFVHVSGTTATDGTGNLLGRGDPYAQTVHALRNIEKALAELGTDLHAVVRTRIYVINIDDWESIGRAHGEFFRQIRPASTMVEVRRLIAPEMLVEVEAEAIIPDGSEGAPPTASREETISDITHTR